MVFCDIFVSNCELLKLRFGERRPMVVHWGKVLVHQPPRGLSKSLTELRNECSWSAWV